MPDAPTLSRRRALGLLGLTAGAAVAPPLLWPSRAAASTRPIIHGVATANLDTMRAFESASGRFVRAYTYYRSWGATVNLTWETSFARQLVSRGTTPVLTFQPRHPAHGVDQPAYSHARIVAGDFDALLRDWAGALRDVGGEVVLRPMHEGNGDWYPWCALANGNSAGSYVAAWCHLRRVFDAAGATNVRWEWSMNKVYNGGTPLEALYPGDDVVDRVGYSGYNGGTIVDRGGWRSFGTVFEETLAESRRITAKPVHVAETSSASGSVGDRAAWITDMWAWLAARPDVTGITWFDFDKGNVDWRLATSAEAVTAYRRGAIATVPPRF
jgi:hypothetical protein